MIRILPRQSLELCRKVFLGHCSIYIEESSRIPTALKSILGDDNYTTRSMDVYVTKLRKYLKADPDLSIENIHGSGFRLLQINAAYN